MKHTVYLGLGSNVGNRLEYLAAAIRSIPDIALTVVDEVSNVYETEPVGTVQQKEFLNIAVSVRTDLDADQFYEKIKWLERQIGRTESTRWGPREIDIDILLYDAAIISSETLEIPHVELEKRRFVLEPLSEIAPNVMHPTAQKTIEEILRTTNDRHTVSLSKEYTSQLEIMINDSITNPTN